MKKSFVIFICLFGFATAQQGTILLEEEGYKGEWPFTVDMVVIWCRLDQSLFIVSYGEDEGAYALNEVAKMHPEYFTGAEADITPIWKNNPKTKAKVALTDVINIGLEKACK